MINYWHRNSSGVFKSDFFIEHDIGLLYLCKTMLFSSQFAWHYYVFLIQQLLIFYVIVYGQEQFEQLLIISHVLDL